VEGVTIEGITRQKQGQIVVHRIDLG